MQSEEEFQETLAIGTAGEDTVYEWLKANYSLVQDVRYQTHNKGTGPRLAGKEGSIILPDFVVYDKFKGCFSVDVKVKTSVYKINGKKYFTVDDYKFRDYLKCNEIMNLDYLMLIFIIENRFHLYTDTEHKGTHIFNNNYGKAAYLFEYDKSKVRY